MAINYNVLYNYAAGIFKLDCFYADGDFCLMLFRLGFWELNSRHVRGLGYLSLLDYNHGHNIIAICHISAIFDKTVQKIIVYPT